jgi:hypothetical protein
LLFVQNVQNDMFEFRYKQGDLVRIKTFTSDVFLMNSNLSGGTALILDGYIFHDAIYYDALVAAASCYEVPPQVVKAIPQSDLKSKLNSLE